MASVDVKKRLVYAIVKFIRSEMDSVASNLTEECKESLEVAAQCLQTSYDFSVEEDTNLDASRDLLDIFKAATASRTERNKQAISEADRQKSELLKTEGNDKMRQSDFDGAVQSYTKAIELDPTNQVFYCNRAAAHSKRGNHAAAITDCESAIEIDSNYSKAYGRLGLAYSALDKHDQAAHCFRVASQLEPENESYKSNLAIAEEKRKGGATANGNSASAGGMMGGIDFNSYLNNPAMMAMASNVLSDPNMQNLLGQMVGGLTGNAASGTAPSANNEQPPNESDASATAGGLPSGLGGLLQVGQRLAEQMQNANPELVNQLRQQMQNLPANEGNSNSKSNASSNNDDGNNGGSGVI